MPTQPDPAGERHPAYLATHQYSRCLERVLAALPVTLQRGVGPTLLRGIARFRAGLVAIHAPRPAGSLRTAWEGTGLCRAAGLDAVRTSRAALELFRREGLGRRADVLAALELLERVEQGLTDA